MQKPVPRRGGMSRRTVLAAGAATALTVAGAAHAGAVPLNGPQRLSGDWF
ncbi:MAG: hypothetical protein HOQ47_15565, partial [Streptomyces sp.]|nr:hypothetical protein [Streptomyces sp.]NUS23148.1 hypothetical protein [Streptomyces sp.]NUS74657.1 hypothetical protein [Streptomyces sp.]